MGAASTNELFIKRVFAAGASGKCKLSCLKVQILEAENCAFRSLKCFSSRFRTVLSSLEDAGDSLDPPLSLKVKRTLVGLSELERSKD